MHLDNKHIMKLFYNTAACIYLQAGSNISVDWLDWVHITLAIPKLWIVMAALSIQTFLGDSLKI